MRFQAVVEVVLAYSLIRFDISPLFFSSRTIGRTLRLLNVLIGSSYTRKMVPIEGRASASF